jgi:hypothetical protein
VAAGHHRAHGDRGDLGVVAFDGAAQLRRRADSPQAWPAGETDAPGSGFRAGGASVGGTSIGGGAALGGAKGGASVAGGTARAA